MNRRDLLRSSIATGAALAIPARLAAQPRAGLPRDAKLAEIAKMAQAKARAREMLWHDDFVGIADYGLRSSEPRFHFVNLRAGTVQSYLVSHGDGSDPDHDGWLNHYSNVEGSHCSSKGTYATFGWYTGRFGTSIRLEGLDPTNDNALDRAIVMHRAKYAEPEFLKKWGVLGRSNGCFAMSDADFKLALLQLGGGRVLHADSFGWAEDGSIVTPPQPEVKMPKNVEVLQPENPTGAEQLNPGVF
ncbi:murein L,D-transpeptidase catalytic domain family protein [Pontixanthobacter aestiaquae]|uniref:Twin-arginine translocation pathway signal n=1 Tax=Pontixanthobacter aestiaquae TaxID=1509367 RepID=A0A844Z1A6_9SPHN|nr:murein L,D-transpeptidase catalytic domain family protein [Pontixanthobacter aestiaquae]MDN3646501.1 murein L,D-transpeptidase catalytic domain family protein [Pontixanthobacter aestiaquae]MXO82511.1 twin-arginine translocation pathway signal [Pontixanthobacter aestiaquae]